MKLRKNLRQEIEELFMNEFDDKNKAEKCTEKLLQYLKRKSPYYLEGLFE